MTDYAELCERLRAKARASFEANKSFGRKGKEWAIETESDWQAAAAIERLSAENEALRKAAEPFVSFAENVDENGWTSSIHKDRISYWFGPSDFRNIATTLKGADHD